MYLAEKALQRLYCLCVMNLLLQATFMKGDSLMSAAHTVLYN